MMGDKSLPDRPPEKRSKAWLWNLLITISVVIGMMGLARIRPELAWGAAAIGLMGLVVSFYIAGRSQR